MHLIIYIYIRMCYQTKPVAVPGGSEEPLFPNKRSTIFGKKVYHFVIEVAACGCVSYAITV